MQKKVILFFIPLLFLIPGFGQDSTLARILQVRFPGVSVGIQQPVGEFSRTHFTGVAVEYSGALRLLKSNRKGNTWLAYNGGIAYYPGRKEKVSGYHYKYPGYAFIHIFGGLLFVPFNRAAISLTGGPALGIYNKNAQFNIGSKIEGAYLLTERIGIAANLVMMKEAGADPLWSAGVKLMWIIH